MPTIIDPGTVQLSNTDVLEWINSKKKQAADDDAADKAVGRKKHHLPDNYLRSLRKHERELTSRKYPYVDNPGAYAGDNRHRAMRVLVETLDDRILTPLEARYVAMIKNGEKTKEQACDEVETQQLAKGLTETEMLQIHNLAPQAVEMLQNIIVDWEERFTGEEMEMMVQVIGEVFRCGEKMPDLPAELPDESRLLEVWNKQQQEKLAQQGENQEKLPEQGEGEGDATRSAQTSTDDIPRSPTPRSPTPQPFSPTPTPLSPASTPFPQSPEDEVANLMGELSPYSIRALLTAAPDSTAEVGTSMRELSPRSQRALIGLNRPKGGSGEEAATRQNAMEWVSAYEVSGGNTEMVARKGRGFRGDDGGFAFIDEDGAERVNREESSEEEDSSEGEDSSEE